MTLVILPYLEGWEKDEDSIQGKDIQGDDFVASSVLLHWKCEVFIVHPSLEITQSLWYIELPLRWSAFEGTTPLANHAELHRELILFILSYSMKYSYDAVDVYFFYQKSLAFWVFDGHSMNQPTPVAQTVKNLPAEIAGDPGLFPGLGRSPGEGNGNPLQYSCLENSIDRGI